MAEGALVGRAGPPENYGGRIQRLEEAVVNRIAAGEVIQRPANAIKEMIENSLDAGSTSVQVTVKAGGLKMLQIQDNGTGMQREDLHIVCERFTTSKLNKFEDLSTLNTYGFRGEALASISHVAHVTITTRTASSKCAYRACYRDGQLVPQRPGGSAEPKPCAGNQGTLISVEDLFYNVNTRRKALKTPSEELARITDIMTKYAVHNSGVSFTLKKHGATSTELKTAQDSSTRDNIGLLYGPAVQKELLPVAAEDERLGFRMSGFVTNANYSMKKLSLLLFINSKNLKLEMTGLIVADRLVDSVPLRRALELVYATVLPKGCHPLIYMSLCIRPENIDVNVHPTKHEVHFLHEDKIIEAIQKSVEEGLLSCDSSRTYYTQALLPCTTGLAKTSGHGKASGHGKTSGHGETSGHDETSGHGKTSGHGETSGHDDTSGHGKTSGHGERSGQDLSQASKLYDYELVRTDARATTLTSYVEPAEPGLRTSGRDSSASTRSSSRRRERQPVSLSSVAGLQGNVSSNKHTDLAHLFARHKFVGLVDQTRAVVQHQTGLFLLDLCRLSKELFYQIIIFDFANFGALKLSPPAPIRELLLLALDTPSTGWCPEDGPKEKLAEYAAECLTTKAEMLREYFSLEIKDGYVHTLPVLLDNFSPNLDRLPYFLLCLAVEVDWTTEKNCFHTFAQECAKFYCIQHDPFLKDRSVLMGSSAMKDRPVLMGSSAMLKDRPVPMGSSAMKELLTAETNMDSSIASLSKPPVISTESAARSGVALAGSPDQQQGGATDMSDTAGLSGQTKRSAWQWSLEHVLLPAMRNRLIPLCNMATDGSVLQIADLHELYRVFERC